MFRIPSWSTYLGFFLIFVECILLLYVINKILTFIPYSQLVLCVYTLYSFFHNMFRLQRAILR
jgi:hypothetical protein